MQEPGQYRGHTRGAHGLRPVPRMAEDPPAPEGVPVVAPDLSKLIPGSAIYTLRQAVTTAGVRVQLPDLPCRSACIRALSGNAGELYIGTDLVDATIGFPMAAGDTLDLAIDNLRRLYIDAANNGDGVAILVVN